jgi:diaminopimelate decarboxylase
VAYSDSEEVGDPYELYSQIRKIEKEYSDKLNRTFKVCVEPGRFLVADSAVLLCKITA